MKMNMNSAAPMPTRRAGAAPVPGRRDLAEGGLPPAALPATRSKHGARRAEIDGANIKQNKIKQDIGGTSVQYRSAHRDSGSGRSP